MIDSVITFLDSIQTYLQKIRALTVEEAAGAGNLAILLILLGGVYLALKGARRAIRKQKNPLDYLVRLGWMQGVLMLT